MRQGIGDEGRKVCLRDWRHMGVFRFKEFEVRNELSAMKVNTDSVLLGALCTVKKEDRRVLDIGTGTGVVALIVAQRLNRVKGGVPRGNVLCSGDCITGIDIDEGAASEAAFNFGGSPWANNMETFHSALDDFSDGSYDLIVSNPPYYENSIQSPVERRRVARHADTLSYRDILSYSVGNLSPDGRVALILPASEKIAVLGDAADKGLYLNKITMIKTIEGKTCSRMVVEFSRCRKPLESEELPIYGADGSYSDEYIKKTSELLDCKF